MPEGPRYPCQASQPLEPPCRLWVEVLPDFQYLAHSCCAASVCSGSRCLAVFPVVRALVQVVPSHPPRGFGCRWRLRFPLTPPVSQRLSPLHSLLALTMSPTPSRLASLLSYASWLFFSVLPPLLLSPSFNLPKTQLLTLREGQLKGSCSPRPLVSCSVVFISPTVPAQCPVVSESASLLRLSSAVGAHQFLCAAAAQSSVCSVVNPHDGFGWAL